MDWRALVYGSPAEQRVIPRGRPTEPALTPLGLIGERLTVDRALGLADVFACVRVLAESAASLPLHVYRRTDAGRERVTTGRLAELLERPAPGVTTSSLVGTAMACLLLHGNAYVGKFRDPVGRIEQLGLIPPAQVRVEVVRGVPVYEINRDGKTSRHGSEDVLHIRAALSTDGILGLSPVGAVRDALSHADALAVQARSFARNAARPSGVLKVAGHTSQEQVDRLRDAFGAHHGTPERVGGVAVMEGELDWTALSLSLVDAQFIEQRQLSTAEVARIFRVPPWMIGAPSGDSMTYSNVAEQASAFVTFSLRPWLVAIEQALSADRDLSPSPLYAEFSLDGLLRADAATRSEVYTRALDPITGWLTRAEVRALENLAPEPERPQIEVEPPAPPAPTPVEIRATLEVPRSNRTVIVRREGGGETVYEQESPSREEVALT